MMTENTSTHRTRRRFWVRTVGAMALLLIIYFGIYIWARTTGLFIWGPMHAMHITPGHVRTIKPIGNMTFIVPPWEDMEPEVRKRREESLAAQNRISKALWPWYSWVASIETA